MSRMPTAPACESFLAAMCQFGHVPSIFLRQLGRPWQAQVKPVNIPWGLPRQCYGNAAQLALARPELTYVEGYAYPGSVIPVHHAWCVDAQGSVVDNTFSDSGQAQYFGFPLSTHFLLKELANESCWGLFAEFASLERFLGALADVQSGVWAVSPDVEQELRALLTSA